MDPIVGIDLGTTNSVVALLKDDGPVIIPNALGEPLTPSVVGLDPDGKLVVGRAARELRVQHPQRCTSLFKRHVGSDWKAALGDRVFTPEELSGLILRSLREDAEAFLGQPVQRAVITVPAYFNDHQRKATLQAGQLAGLQVARILNEPTAAALAYGFHEAKEDKTLLIVDLGGGTLDVSLVELFEGTIEVRASAGENFLGGEDFTRALAARVLQARGQSYEHLEAAAPALVARLLLQCERAKCRLSQEEATTLRLPDREGRVPEDAPQVTVTRAELEEWCKPTLARMERPIRQVLNDAGLKPAGVHEVLLVGGATRMPLVQRLVERLLERPPQCRLNPEEVVARVAAVQAALFAGAAGVEDLVVTDVAPFTLGVEVCKHLGLEHRGGYFLPVIHRNTTIPTSRVQQVSTVEPNQTTVVVRVFQGEARRVEDNLLLGEFKVTGIPPSPHGSQVLALRFTYDLNGVLEVEAVVEATQARTAHVITKHVRGLTPEQVAQAVANLQRLKTHPRDEAPNRLLLQRAERVLRELPPLPRQHLDRLLDAFEAALATQDPEVIAGHRAALAAFLAEVDPDGGGEDAP